MVWIQPEHAKDVAAKIGYPVMLKAAAGGGGKGMRLVHAPDRTEAALEAAQSEAHRSFGDSEVYLEKAIVNPRHIEMQVLADEHGNTVYLGERECSIQRRHQKVLEEAPSPVVDPDMRRRMGEVAVRVAKAASYANAGTIEFLVDQAQEFLLPGNEHAAAGGASSHGIGHRARPGAICKSASPREKSFHSGRRMLSSAGMPSSAASMPKIRTTISSPARARSRADDARRGRASAWTAAVYDGWTVPIDYDPLLAKLIGYGEDRQQAIAKLARALPEYFVAGIKTNLGLFRRILADQDFQSGKIDTGIP